MKTQFDPSTPVSFCEIFEQHMNKLYLLALLLAGDSAGAEQCFLAGIESCLNGRTVLEEQAYSWSKRAIIKNAIRFVAPALEADGQISFKADEANNQTIPADLDPVRRMPPFDRFVFVMSVLERYTNRECAVLLNCTVQDIERARSRSLLQVARNSQTTPVVRILSRHTREIPANPVCA